MSTEEHGDVNAAEANRFPAYVLKRRAQAMRIDILSEEFSRRMDEIDPLSAFRDKFYIPKMKDLPCIKSELLDCENDCVYLCGNSLGLKPKSADLHMNKCLDNWSKCGVLSHHSGELPAVVCDLPGIPATARLVGALPQEVALMNGLTVNLHLLMVSFYRPTPQRNKILMEAHAFPSDRYAIKSQIRFHGYDVDETLIQLSPREGEYYLRNEDILDAIEKHGDSIALVMFSGVQYYTGQKFDMQSISEAGHAKGCIVGFDLAHAIGNVKLHLHDWGIDFACWCSYKYLNSGAGGIAGAFIHEKHNACQIPKLHGWWSNIQETRFDMKEDPDLEIGVASLRLSNPPPFLACLNMASLEIFDETSMDDLISKQFLLTGYLELLLDVYFPNDNDQPFLTIITPRDPEKRGCQLSLKFANPAEKIHGKLEENGILCDVRKPNVLRLAPAPLYNSFYDVYQFVNLLRNLSKN